MTKRKVIDNEKDRKATVAEEIREQKVRRRRKWKQQRPLKKKKVGAHAKPDQKKKTNKLLLFLLHKAPPTLVFFSYLSFPLKCQCTRTKEKKRSGLPTSLEAYVGKGGAILLFTIIIIIIPFFFFVACVPHKAPQTAAHWGESSRREISLSVCKLVCLSSNVSEAHLKAHSPLSLNRSITLSISINK